MEKSKKIKVWSKRNNSKTNTFEKKPRFFFNLGRGVKVSWESAVTSRRSSFEVAQNCSKTVAQNDQLLCLESSFVFEHGNNELGKKQREISGNSWKFKLNSSWPFGFCKKIWQKIQTKSCTDPLIQIQLATFSDHITVYVRCLYGCRRVQIEELL